MIGRPRARIVDALKDLFHAQREESATLKLRATDVADLIAYVERLEAEVSRLRAAENFGTDAA